MKANTSGAEVYDYTVFPQLDALHILDTSARFDAGWSGHNTF